MSRPKKTKKQDTKEVEKKDRANRRKVLAISIKKAWESLDSHLSDSVVADRAERKQGANEEWHARCCLDYATIIYGSARELHELAKIDFPVICTGKEFKPNE
jgi:hypothetical protein